MEENRRSLEAFVRANAAVLEGMAALSAEMLAFGNKRLSANIERSQTLVGCEDMEQAFQVHTEFFESAVRQYLDQANQVMTIMSTISRSFWALWGPRRRGLRSAERPVRRSDRPHGRPTDPRPADRSPRRRTGGPNGAS